MSGSFTVMVFMVYLQVWMFGGRSVYLLPNDAPEITQDLVFRGRSQECGQGSSAVSCGSQVEARPSTLTAGFLCRRYLVI